jgi:hypothetical protein
MAMWTRRTVSFPRMHVRPPRTAFLLGSVRFSQRGQKQQIYTRHLRFTMSVRRVAPSFWHTVTACATAQVAERRYSDSIEHAYVIVFPSAQAYGPWTVAIAPITEESSEKTKRRARTQSGSMAAWIIRLASPAWLFGLASQERSLQAGGMISNRSGFAGPCIGCLRLGRRLRYYRIGRSPLLRAGVPREAIQPRCDYRR